MDLLHFQRVVEVTMLAEMHLLFPATSCTQFLEIEKRGQTAFNIFESV